MKKTVETTFTDFNINVMPNIQKLTKSVIDFGKRTGENAGTDLIPTSKKFGENTAERFMT